MADEYLIIADILIVVQATVWPLATIVLLCRDRIRTRSEYEMLSEKSRGDQRILCETVSELVNRVSAMQRLLEDVG